MNITRHARERYIERIKGVTDKSERIGYLNTNTERIDENINKLFEFSELVYTGQIGGDKTTKDFYLNGDTCLVVNKECVITIYKLNFAFPKHTVNMIISDLIEEIKKIQSEIDKEKPEIDSQKQTIDEEISLNKLKIKALEEEIESVRFTNKHKENAKEVLSKGISIKHKKMQVYAEQLLGNTDYKQDI